MPQQPGHTSLALESPFFFLPVEVEKDMGELAWVTHINQTPPQQTHHPPASLDAVSVASLFSAVAEVTALADGRRLLLLGLLLAPSCSRIIPCAAGARHN